MKHTKNILLFALTVTIGLAGLGSITWIKQIVNHEFFWSGIPGVFVEYGFFIGYLLVIVLSGFITSLVFRDHTVSRKELLVISACSGFVTGVIYLFVMQVRIVFYEYQNGHFITSTSAWDIIPWAFRYFFMSGPSMFLITLAMMVLGITGSLIFSYASRPPEYSLPDRINAEGKPVRVKIVIIVFIAAILLSVLLPIGMDIAAISSRTSTCSFCAVWSPVSMKVTRSDISTVTLRISMDSTSHSWTRGIPFKSQPLQIMVDDRDFSNQSIIRQQGLTDTISPYEGIAQYADGSSVTISGPEIARNESTGRHIYVVSYYDQNNPWVVVDTYI